MNWQKPCSHKTHTQAASLFPSLATTSFQSLPGVLGRADVAPVSITSCGVVLCTCCDKTVSGIGRLAISPSVVFSGVLR